MWVVVGWSLGVGASVAASPPAVAPASPEASPVPWLDAGRATPWARQAVQWLQDAASQGLDPQEYRADALARTVAAAAQAPLATPAAVALQQTLTAAVTRYLTDLHFGRVDPRSIHHNFRVLRPDPFDATQALRDAVQRQDLTLALNAATPHIPLYGRLRESLATYRALAGHTAWATPLPVLPRPAPGKPGKLVPGQAYGGLTLLGQRLRLLGDLTGPPPSEGVYEGAWVEAVRHFQVRHGLADDGVVGTSTLRALEVSPQARARQIELALERLRWTPLMQAPRMIVVNLPEFVLRAYEVQGERMVVRLEMKVVVGRALDTRTPLFDEDMRFIEFSPYWNVPPSIARQETVPRLRRDPAYFERQGFEFVRPDGQVETALSADHLNAVMAGQMRLRQRPGTPNALGDIKFVFPNSDNIYLHHTPATALFARQRRDFSHGCIRVEEPVALAKFVLETTPGWDEARIRGAMARGSSNTLRLAQTIPVLISYGTALVKNDQTYFYDDIYGHDRLLDAALRERASGHFSQELPRP